MNRFNRQLLSNLGKQFLISKQNKVLGLYINSAKRNIMNNRQVCILTYIYITRTN